MDNQHIANRYLRFARNEAHGKSPIYERLANHVASSYRALAFLARLPKDRQQPNLFFAAIRFVHGAEIDADTLDDVLDMHDAAIEQVMRTRTTQTNEPGRCAALMPLLAQVRGPLALIEVGASAGLCLLPDAYGYDWGQHKLTGQSGAPILSCTVNKSVPLPSQPLTVEWRAGLDLNPMNLHAHEDTAWLEQLVWPEHRARRERLQHAIAFARQHPPSVHKGDLLNDLQKLIDSVPTGLNIVVFHTAVLSYVADQKERDRFANDMVQNPDVTWISNEGLRVFPQIAEHVTQHREDMFLISKNGHPMAWSGPHGQNLIWM